MLKKLWTQRWRKCASRNSANMGKVIKSTNNPKAPRIKEGKTSEYLGSIMFFLFLSMRYVYVHILKVFKVSLKLCAAIELQAKQIHCFAAPHIVSIPKKSKTQKITWMMTKKKRFFFIQTKKNINTEQKIECAGNLKPSKIEKYKKQSETEEKGQTFLRKMNGERSKLKKLGKKEKIIPNYLCCLGLWCLLFAASIHFTCTNFAQHNETKRTHYFLYKSFVWVSTSTVIVFSFLFCHTYFLRVIFIIGDKQNFISPPKSIHMIYTLSLV